MRVDAFLTHLRSECAVHRWDIASDDDASRRLLGQFDLFKHAVTAIGSRPMTARGVAAGAAEGPPLAARLLLLWGRTPQPPARAVITGPQAEALRVRRLLAGY